MEYLIPYLRTQFKTARAVLFTGAGFSLEAKNISGQPVPSAGKLKELLWSISFPDDLFDDASDLQHVFEAAFIRRPAAVAELLSKQLSVDGKSLPGWYATYFRLPWHKCYSLNIDDLPLRCGGAIWLPRKIELVSGTTGKSGATESDKDVLKMTCLNGNLSDGPKHLTFSSSQYAERLARQDPFYCALAAELMSLPFVFVGTSLDESTLWQHIQLRQDRGGASELRPKSILVTPHLDKARQVALTQHNVEWVQMTAKQFAEEVLSKLEDTYTEGISVVSRKSATSLMRNAEIPEVSTLLNGKNDRTEFLLGTEPVWSDIQSGRAIHREVDAALWKQIQARLKGSHPKGLLVLTGTAGSGKSTSLMRLAAKLSVDGKKVGWVDRDSAISLWALKQLTRNNGPKFDAIAIDDADLLGTDLSATCRELCETANSPLLILGIRSGKLDRAINPAQLGAIPIEEVVMPLLTDGDISGLIDALTKDNKLGKLRGLVRKEQENALREKAGRELLVAMIEATSGERFEEKAVHEFEDLGAESKRIYAVVATATSQNFPLTKANLLMALGKWNNNNALNAIDQLVRRKIIVLQDTITYRARHRVVAELIQKKLQNSGQLHDVLLGLISVLATQVHPGMPPSAKPKRLLVRMINNSFLHMLLGPEYARNLYSEVEEYLKDEAHYWLQRGVLEVEAGNLRLAKNWLDQAKAINPSDDYVEVEYALWQFRTALENTNDPSSTELVRKATLALDHQIAMNGKRNAHPYHVMGSQALAWVRRSQQTFEEKKDLLLHALERLQEGVKYHPTNEPLSRVLKELEDERFHLVLR